MSLPKDVDRGAPRTSAASMATERAGAVRAAVQGRAAARPAGPERMWRTRSARLFCFAMQRPQAGGKEAGEARCGRADGGGTPALARPSRSMGPQRASEPAPHRRTQPSRRPTHTDDGVVRFHRPVRAPLRSAPRCRPGPRLVVYRLQQTRAVRSKGPPGTESTRTHRSVRRPTRINLPLPYRREGTDRLQETAAVIPYEPDAG